MYSDDSGIFILVIKCFCITNTSVQNLAIRISSVKTTEVFAETKSFLNKFNIDVILSSLLMSSLCASQLSKILRKSCDIISNPSLAPLLNMRRCTL